MRTYRILLVLAILIGLVLDAALFFFPPYQVVTEQQVVFISAASDSPIEPVEPVNPVAESTDTAKETVLDLPKYDGVRGSGNHRFYFDMQTYEVVATEYLPATAYLVSAECIKTQLEGWGYSAADLLVLDPSVPEVEEILINRGIHSDHMQGRPITPYCDGFDMKHTSNLNGWEIVPRAGKYEGIGKDGYTILFYSKPKDLPEALTADYDIDTFHPGEVFVVLQEPDGSLRPWMFIKDGAVFRVEVGGSPIFLTWESVRSPGARVQVVKPMEEIYGDFPIGVGNAVSPCDGSPSLCGMNEYELSTPILIIDGQSVEQYVNVFR